MPTRNDRETGARKFPLRPDATDTDRENIDAAENKPPPSSQGLSQDIDETIDKTHQSDGQRMAVPNPDTPGGRLSRLGTIAREARKQRNQPRAPESKRQD
jgi:hypothetical protein